MTVLFVAFTVVSQGLTFCWSVWVHASISTSAASRGGEIIRVAGEVLIISHVYRPQEMSSITSVKGTLTCKIFKKFDIFVFVFLN
jgi:hypothetical protein